MWVAAVDDNEEDLALLKGYLDRFSAEQGVKIQTDLFESSVEFVETYKNNYDVIFLDVEMPGMDGMEVAREIRRKDDTVGIIFITNMIQYAIHGYEVNAIDFMVKPVGYFNFADKLNKALHFVRRRNGKEILVTGEEGAVRLEVSDVIYVEKEKNYLIFHTFKGNFRTRGTMQELRDRLGNLAFSECTTGCLVNLKYVERIEKNTVLVEGRELPVSRRLKKEFMQDFIDYVGGVI